MWAQGFLWEHSVQDSDSGTQIVNGIRSHKFTGGYFMEKITRDETLKLRVSKQEKASYEERASKAGLSTSALIRAVMNNEGKLIFLEEGSKIAEGFCICNKLLSHFMAQGQLADRERIQLTNHMEQITNLLYKVTQKLSVIDANDEGGDC